VKLALLYPVDMSTAPMPCIVRYHVHAEMTT
jgi:hypothetical protein